MARRPHRSVVGGRGAACLTRGDLFFWNIAGTPEIDMPGKPFEPIGRDRLELPCIFIPEGYQGPRPGYTLGRNTVEFRCIFIPNDYEGPRPGYPWIEFGRMTLEPKPAAGALELTQAARQTSSAAVAPAGNRTPPPDQPWSFRHRRLGLANSKCSRQTAPERERQPSSEATLAAPLCAPPKFPGNAVSLIAPGGIRGTSRRGETNWSCVGPLKILAAV